MHTLFPAHTPFFPDGHFRILSGKKMFFQVMDNYGHPGISREFIVHAAGLGGFKRILHYTKTRDTYKLKSILKHLHLKIENLEAVVEKAPKDLNYIK